MSNGSFKSLFNSVRERERELPAEGEKPAPDENTGRATRPKSVKPQEAKERQRKVPGPTIAQARPVDPDTDKIVRDGYSMPRRDYEIIARVRLVAARNGVLANNSAILRAALRALDRMPEDQLVEMIASLDRIKRGPKPGDRLAEREKI